MTRSADERRSLLPSLLALYVVDPLQSKTLDVSLAASRHLGAVLHALRGELTAADVDLLFRYYAALSTPGAAPPLRNSCAYNLPVRSRCMQSRSSRRAGGAADAGAG